MKKNRRRVTITVTPQTLYHLERMTAACGYTDMGRAVDRLVQEHQMAARINTPKERAGIYHVWK